MIPFNKYLKLTAVALIGLRLCAQGARTPQHIDIKQLSKTVEDVVVPLPNEIFGALKKLGAVNWKEHVRSDKGTNFTERQRIALSLVTKHFSADGAELLHQPDLLSYFQTRLEAMPEFKLPIIREIEDALVQVKPLIDVGNARIPQESVRKINEITTRLGYGIVTRD